MFLSLLKIAAAPVDFTVSLAADVVTAGGELNDKHSSYTADAAKRLMGNVEDLTSSGNDRQ